MDCDGILARGVDNERRRREKMGQGCRMDNEREWDLPNDLRRSLPTCKIMPGPREEDDREWKKATENMGSCVFKHHRHQPDTA